MIKDKQVENWNIQRRYDFKERKHGANRESNENERGDEVDKIVERFFRYLGYILQKLQGGRETQN